MPKEENRFKKYNMLLNVFLIATLFLSIGYAQIVGDPLEVEGTATAYEHEGVYVSGVNYSSSTHAHVDASSTKQRVGATVVSRVVLDNDSSASITYQVTVTNGTQSKYIYVGPAVSENFYSNPNIGYSVSGINVGDILDPNDTRTFNLTYSLDSPGGGVTSDLDAYINFGFRELYPVTYVNIQGSGYPEYVVKYRTSDSQPIELNVDFGTNAPTSLEITGVDSGTLYTLGTDYTYSNGVLNFPNVSEGLIVEQPVPNNPPVINSLTVEQQDTQGDVKVLFNATDDLGIDHYELKTYQVVNGVDTLISTDTIANTETEFPITNIVEGGTYFFNLTVYDIKGLTVDESTQPKEYKWNLTVTININNGGPNGTTATTFGSAFNTTLTVNQGYNNINNLTVTMGGNTLTAGTDYTYTTNSGAFAIQRVTGDVSITGNAAQGGICLVEGTKVRLANGKEKNIEDITYEDLLLVWSYEEGRVVEEYPLWIEKGKRTVEYYRITFSDSSTIGIFKDHAFFSSDENKFVNFKNTDSFHVGTHILKVSKDNKLKEVTVTKIEEVKEEKGYYFVASTRYYNIISDDFITTDAYTDITNLYPFNDNITWVQNRDVKILDYKYLQDVLPYYMYKGFRAGEVAVLLSSNKTNIDSFRAYVKYLVLADYMMQEPITKNGKRYWPVSVESNKINNKQKLVKEGDYYTLPFGKWYSTSENKYYKTGDKVQVWTGMYFEKK